ncbi:unnamed protein product [Effrenium voratum]|nr:unnamed protein product [Effrenium voratum]
MISRMKEGLGTLRKKDSPLEAQLKEVVNADAYHFPNIILQDVDGVLTRSTEVDLDPKLVGRLSQVVRGADVGLVLSSGRRKAMPALNHLLRGLGSGRIPPGRILGVTPSLCRDTACRAEEIKSWLRANERLADANWVAVDDQDIASQDPEFFRGHFLQADPAEGLTEEKASQLSSMLAPGRSQASRSLQQAEHAAAVKEEAAKEQASHCARPRGSYREEMKRALHSTYTRED